MRRFLAAMAVFVSLCAIPHPSEAGKKDDTLVWATDRENSITDSNYLNTRELVIIGSLIYDRLIHLDDKYEPQPLLATAWTWVNDTTLDLDIRKGVKFHNGKELDADDVVYTLDFVNDKANGALSYSYVSYIKSVEKLDSYKVRLHFKKPFPTALIFLAGVPNIMAKGHYDNAPVKPDGKKDFGAVPANGTGPYKVAEIKPGESILMEKNASYWEGSPKGKPQIGKLKFRTVKDSNTRLAEVMTGAIDWVWDVPKDQAERMMGAPNLVVENAKTMRFAYIIFDAKGVSGQKAFTDKRVRQAVAHAINRESIVKNLVGAPSEVINAVCHPDQFACADDVPKYDYNPDKARKLLAEAGYPNGFEFELHAYRERELTEAVIGDLVKVGLKPKLAFLQYAALLQAVHTNKVAAAHMTWGSSSIPDVSASAGHFFTGTKDDLSQDPEVMRLIAEADGTVDREKRQILWKQALTRIAEEAYWVPLFTYAKFYIYSKDLSFKPTSDEIPQFYKASWK
ncbi:MAG TPA: ABC transporter substrate-binding protein [Devosia sp.]|nr:ABC transporter substrate-binding protein [Devosia sp.]